MAPTHHTKGKATLPPNLSTKSTPTQQFTQMAKGAEASQSLSLYSLSPTQHITISRTNLAKLITEQVAFTLTTYQTREIQFPSKQGTYKRQGTVISSMKPLTTYESHS
jgi:hypothetical protein